MKIPATDKEVQQAINKLFVKKNTLQEDQVRNVLYDWLRGNMDEWLVKNKARAGKLIWASLQDVTQAMPVMEEQLKSLVNASMNAPAGKKAIWPAAKKEEKKDEKKDEGQSLYCKITQIQKILAGSYAGVIAIMYAELKRVIQETKRRAG